MTSDARMPMGQQMAFHVKVFNNSILTGALDLTKITMRYWFLADGSKSLAFNCDYAMLSCANLTGTFTTMATPTASADTYLEVSFASGSVPPGGADSGEIQIRLTDKNYAVTFDETKDWSFDATKTAYAPWGHITLYKAGVLIWGTEPQ